jgi:glycosyltransferase involved in cell wall biosynthesis
VRLALLTEVPAPFRVPLFNALAARDDVEPLVLFLAAADPRRPYYRLHADEHRFRSQVLPGREVSRGGRWVVVSRGVVRALRRFDPQIVVVGGWNQPGFWEALVWAKAKRRPVVTWVESTARDSRSGSRPLEAAKRALVRASDGFLVPGRASAAYLRGFGIGDRPVATAPNAVDAAVFSRAAVDRSGRGRPTLLYAGRFDPEKGLDVLLEAVRGLEADLVLVGSGREEERLRAAAPANVRFEPPVDRDGVARYYAEADAYVLPSRSEQWGMVLNEAATAGLPIVASDAAGAAYELVEDGVNGFRVPAGDAVALRRALERVVDPDFRASAGARSRELAAAHTPEAWADAVAGLARTLVG